MRILVLGAGGPAGVNTLRALQFAGHQLIAADANEDHLAWCEPFAETVHMPKADVRAVNDLEPDLVLAQPDSLVEWLADHRAAIDAATFLPDHDVIERCQHKPDTVMAWYVAGLRRQNSLTISEPWPDHLRLAQDDFGLPFWLRAKQGAGAKGAIKVTSCDQAFHWIRFWQSRGADMEWMAEEFLPGRDLAWSSIWFQGELVTSFARERIEYLYPHLTPEGLTGTPTIARVVHDELLNSTAEQAVRMVDDAPHGIYSVDLREDEEGTPRPTEINAGRSFTTLGLWSIFDANLNFCDIAVQHALNGWSDIGYPRYDALPEGLTLSRHIDCDFQFLRVPVAA